MTSDIQSALEGAVESSPGLDLVEQVTLFRSVLLEGLRPQADANIEEGWEEHFDTCRERAVGALQLSQEAGDSQIAIALQLAAAELPWPSYSGGDGYWIEASDVACALTVAGQEVSDQDLLSALLDYSAADQGEAAKWALAYLDLGLVGNQFLDRDAVLQVVSRSAVDPVRVIAMTHPELELEDVADILQQVSDGTWLRHALNSDDGWTWPDFQYAFGIASAASDGDNCAAIWQLMLSARCVQLGTIGEYELLATVDLEWLDEFFEELEEGFEDLAGLTDTFTWLTSLSEAIDKNFDVAQAAREANWTPSDLVLAGRARALREDLAWLAEHENATVRTAVAANTNTPRELLAALAADQDPQVREAVIRNPSATDEIRASAGV